MRRLLGQFEVGAIGMGCVGMSGFYGASDEAEAILAIERAISSGVTLFDTADVYGMGENERFVGRRLRRHETGVVISTKVGIDVLDYSNFSLRPNGRPERLTAGIDDSLRRLGRDSVDLVILHRVDPEVAVEESIGALGEAVEAGKVGGIGLSEASLDQIERAHATFRLDVVQSEFSLWAAEAGVDVVPWCGENGVGFMAYCPLGRGFLAGAVSRRADIEADGDYRRFSPRFTAEAIRANRRIYEAIAGVAERLGATPAQLSLAWLLGKGAHVVPIPGMERERFVAENLGAIDLRIGAEEMAELDSLPAAEGSRY